MTHNYYICFKYYCPYYGVENILAAGLDTAIQKQKMLIVKLHENIDKQTDMQSSTRNC